MRTTAAATGQIKQSFGQRYCIEIIELRAIGTRQCLYDCQDIGQFLRTGEPQILSEINLSQ